MFWENAEDSGNQAVYSARTLNRFQEILSALHFADNNLLNTNDKMARIRPFLAILDECFLQFWPPCQSVNIDESLVPYYDQRSAKPCIRGKSIRYGYKIWCLNTPDGYLVQMEPYQGAGTVRIQPLLGTEGSVV